MPMQIIIHRGYSAVHRCHGLFQNRQNKNLLINQTSPYKIGLVTVGSHGKQAPSFKTGKLNYMCT